MKTIDPVKPAFWHRSYSNPDSQGTLITQTRNWPRGECTEERAFYSFTGIEAETVRVDAKPCRVPGGLDISGAYVDRMQMWDRKKWEKCVEYLPKNCGLNSALETATDEALLAMANTYFDDEVVAVRWVYYFNVATGYDCQAVQYLYKAK